MGKWHRSGGCVMQRAVIAGRFMPPVTMHGIDNRFTLQGFSPKKFVICQGCDCIKQDTRCCTMQTVMCVLCKWMGQKADSVSLFIKTVHSAV